MLRSPDENLATVVDLVTRIGETEPCDLIVFPELSCHGLNPQIRESLTESFSRYASQRVAAACKSARVAAMVGIASFAGSDQQPMNGYFLYGENGSERHRWEKQLLHGDEAMVFSAGKSMGPVSMGGMQVDCLLCHELWHEQFAERARTSNVDCVIVPRMVSAETHSKAVEYSERNGCSVIIANWSNHTFYPGKGFGRSIIAQCNSNAQVAPAGLECYGNHDTGMPNKAVNWTPLRGASYL
jgi:predicted amidohydrolase